jgi:methionine-rich copper-binding protein CopC
LFNANPGARLRGIAAALLTATLVLASSLTALAVVGAGVASAHATRVATDPVENAELSQTPQKVSGTFSEALQPEFAAMTVVGPDRNLWSTGDPQVGGAVISVGVRPLGPSGTYTVNYRVTSADGHVVSGSWSFRLSVASTGTPGPSASTTAPSGDGIPVWPFFVAAGVIVAAGAFWAARRQR